MRAWAAGQSPSASDLTILGMRRVHLRAGACSPRGNCGHHARRSMDSLTKFVLIFLFCFQRVLSVNANGPLTRSLGGTVRWAVAWPLGHSAAPGRLTPACACLACLACLTAVVTRHSHRQKSNEPCLLFNSAHTSTPPKTRSPWRPRTPSTTTSSRSRSTPPPSSTFPQLACNRICALTDQNRLKKAYRKAAIKVRRLATDRVRLASS